jgi:hypothetical protein
MTQRPTAWLMNGVRFLLIEKKAVNLRAHNGAVASGRSALHAQHNRIQAAADAQQG